jgi:hypothetical protein
LDISVPVVFRENREFEQTHDCTAPEGDPPVHHQRSFPKRAMQMGKMKALVPPHHPHRGSATKI